MNTRAYWWGPLALGAMSFGAGPACTRIQETRDTPPASASPPTTDVLSAPADVYPNVRVLTDEVAALARLDGDTVYLPATEATSAYQPGDVLVSGVGRGLLRKVTSLPQAAPAPASLKPLGLGDAWVSFPTVLASFVDVFRNVDATLVYTPDAIVHDASGTVIIDGLTLSRASMTLRPKATLTVRIVDGELDTVSATIDDVVDLTAALKLSASQAVEWSGSVTAWESPHIPVRFVLGGVPIVSEVFVDLFFSANAEASAEASYEVGKSCSRTATASVTWQRGSWSADPALSDRTCTTIGPSVQMKGTASARLKATLEAEWNFYAIGALRIPLDRTVEASLETCPSPGKVAITAAWAASVAADFNPFGIHVDTLQRELFSVPEALASSTLNMPPELCGEKDSDAGVCSASETQCGGATSNQCCDTTTEQCCPTAATVCCPKSWTCNVVAGECNPSPADGGASDAGDASSDAGTNGLADGHWVGTRTWIPDPPTAPFDENLVLEIVDRSGGATTGTAHGWCPSCSLPLSGTSAAGSIAFDLGNDGDGGPYTHYTGSVSGGTMSGTMAHSFSPAHGTWTVTRQ